jgi:hypothetical protein
MSLDGFQLPYESNRSVASPGIRCSPSSIGSSGRLTNLEILPHLRETLNMSFGTRLEMFNIAKLHWRSILPMTSSKFALGISLVVIHPYIAEQVTSFGVPTSVLGFWVGAIESFLRLAEVYTCPVFVYLSEYMGHKPVFLCCMMAYSWCLLPIRLSKTFGALFFWRTAQGMFTAHSPIAKGVVVEVCGMTNRSQGKYQGICFWKLSDC